MKIWFKFLIFQILFFVFAVCMAVFVHDIIEGVK